MWMDYEAFADLVGEALDGLPEEIRGWLDNVEVVVEDWPSRWQMYRVGIGPGGMLLGLYEGIPKTARTTNYNLVLPDKITIFRGPLTRTYRTPTALVAGVTDTVYHEIAHHFGISDARLSELRGGR